jgi:hypothetical protein
MKCVFAILVFFISSTLMGQAISRSVISSLGGQLVEQNNTARMVGNMGEAVIGRLFSVNGSVQLGSGFIPSLEIILLGVPQFEFSYIVFPNPTSDAIRVSHPVAQTLEYSIYNSLGQFISKGIQGVNETINMYHLSSGTYLVNITGDDGSKGLFKIIKR